MTATAAPPRTATPPPLYQTSVGRKITMAVTGALLWAFVTVHMLGNLKIFTGAVHFDEYAEFLRRIGDPVLGHAWYLWVQRAVLLVALLLHIWCAYATTRQARAARPVRYAYTANVQANYASRTMRWGGVALFLYIVFHLLDLSTGNLHPGGEFVSGEVYNNTVESLKLPWVSAIYIAAVAALGMHLYHGTWSIFQTLGITGPKADPWIRRFSAAYGIFIFAGFSLVPVCVLLGVIG